MSATAAPVASDRSDFRTVTVGGAKLGVATAVAVVAFLAASRLVPITGGLRGGVEALIVLAAGVAVAFLPAQWTAARSTEGIAGAAALGLVATVVFSAIDIVLLRPFKAYPWTWDAIGGGSTWWRSEEHTSELQSRPHLVCRLLLEKKTRLPPACFMLVLSLMRPLVGFSPVTPRPSVPVA